MSFNAKIADRMRQLHLSKAQLAKAADIPYTTLDSMLKRDSDQKRMLSMLRIAEILGTSVEELVLCEEELSLRRDTLSPAERELLEQFRRLDERGRAAVQALARHEGEQCDTDAVILPLATLDETLPERLIKVYDFPAAAGAPLPLFSEDYTLENAPEAPRQADFGIRISGNSMEPLIEDGSVVWVKQMESVSDGQIGIFLFNGEALCKRLSTEKGACRLLSVNPAYAPIPVHAEDDLRVVGQVLL